MNEKNLKTSGSNLSGEILQLYYLKMNEIRRNENAF